MLSRQGRKGNTGNTGPPPSRERPTIKHGHVGVVCQQHTTAAGDLLRRQVEEIGLRGSRPASVAHTTREILGEPSRFPTEKQFVSHVTLIPHKPMSGGKPVRKKRRVAAALRMAAVTLRNSATALGAYYRKMARRLGGDVAVFATAKKLAT